MIEKTTRLTSVLLAFKRLMQDDYTEEEELIDIDGVDAQTVLKSLTVLSHLEEKVGMPLDILFTKVIGKNVYTWDEKTESIISFKAVSLKFENNEYYIDTLEPWYVTTKDFNINWLLTHEEAEKRLEEMKNG